MSLWKTTIAYVLKGFKNIRYVFIFCDMIMVGLLLSKKLTFSLWRLLKSIFMGNVNLLSSSWNSLNEHEGDNFFFLKFFFSVKTQFSCDFFYSSQWRSLSITIFFIFLLWFFQCRPSIKNTSNFFILSLLQCRLTLTTNIT